MTTAMTQPTPIILLKTKSQPTDPYFSYFSTHPLPHGPTRTIFIPVLQHTHTNLPTISTLLTSPASYGGLIITSQRAVESFNTAISALPAASTSAFLQSTAVYTVGPATSTAVMNLGFRRENVHGKECGTGIALAEHILASYRTPEKPLLFCNSAARGEFIPSALASKIPLEELVVYETRVDDGFAGEFARVLGENGYGGERWVVVFSPTGAEKALEIVRDRGDQGGKTFWAAIGPTTEGHLIGLGRKPEVVAERPSPEGLLRGIARFMESGPDCLRARYQSSAL